MEPPNTDDAIDFSEFFSMERIGYNSRSLNFCRIFVAIVSGMVSGILGFTGILGLFAFLFTTGLLSIGLYFKVSCDARPFFKKPNDIWTEGVSQAAMSYILFWTLFYDVRWITAHSPCHTCVPLMPYSLGVLADCTHLLSTAQLWSGPRVVGTHHQVQVRQCQVTSV